MQTPSGAQAPATLVVGPEEGTSHHVFGDTIQVKVGPQHTGGAFSVCLGIASPGSGPPPHRHNKEDEVALIIDGQWLFLINGEWIEVAAGSVVYIPRGVVHTFKNVGDTPARAWVLSTPSGFETYMGKCAAVLAEANGGPPDFARLFSIANEHGIENVPSLPLP